MDACKKIRFYTPPLGAIPGVFSMLPHVYPARIVNAAQGGSSGPIYTKTGLYWAGFLYVFALRPSAAPYDVFLPGNINILPGPVSPVLGRLGPLFYAYWTICVPGWPGYLGKGYILLPFCFQFENIFHF